MRNSKPSPGLLVLLMVATLAGYCLIWRECQVTTDSREYLAIARDLLEGRPVDSTLRTPGYPAFLVLCFRAAGGENLAVVLVVQAILHALTILCVFRLALRLTGRYWLSVAAGGTLLLPNFTLGIPSLLTEELAVFLLAATLLLLLEAVLRNSPALAAFGGLLGVALALTRPAYQMLGPLLLVTCAFVLIRQEGLRRGVGRLVLGVLPFVVVLGVGVGVWSERNYRAQGFRGLTCAAGYHLTTRTVSYLERAPDRWAVEREILIQVRNRHLVRRGGTHTGLLTAWSATKALRAATGLDQAGISRRLLAMNKDLILAAPLNYAGEVAFSAVRYWMPPVVRGIMPSNRLQQLPYMLIHLGYLVAVVYLMAITVTAYTLTPAALRSLAPEQHLATAMLWTTALYAWAITCLVETGGPRHRSPTDFCWLLLIAGIAPLARAIRQGQAEPAPQAVPEMEPVPTRPTTRPVREGRVPTRA